MNVRAEKHTYRETGKFLPLVLDYLEQRPLIGSLHHGLPSVQSIKESIERRRSFSTDRVRLVASFQQQYQSLPAHARAQEQIRSLSRENTYTITTAHQCNIFLGPLYTLYKALHAIRIADELNRQLPEYHFVPVFYLGSEDADLAELDHIHLMGEELKWRTDQRGAVGRMKVDQGLIDLIDRQAQLLSAFPHGSKWIEHIRTAYQLGSTLADGSFSLLHQLFADKGLLVLEPDQAGLKSLMHDAFWKEVDQSASYQAVSVANAQLTEWGYSAQAHARPINLFYLLGDRRERIERAGSGWTLSDGSRQWNEVEMKQALQEHPERFSPNVILRGLYQETILPNLVYIGGGAELAYWLQLKSVFDAFGVPFPLLELRASMQWMEDGLAKRMQRLNLNPADLFRPTDDLLRDRMSLQERAQLDLQMPMNKLIDLYGQLSNQAAAVDPTLGPHVESLRVQALKKIEALAKKMERAQRRKMTIQRTQIQQLQQAAFPGGGLQERRDNAAYYYSLHGEEWLDRLYAEMDPFGRSFTWLFELT